MLKKRILLVTTSTCGGSERVTVTMAQNLYSQGYEVKLIVFEIGKINEIKHFIPDFINTSYYKVNRLRNSFFVLFNILKKERPVYIFSSISLIGIYLIILSFYFLNIKTIIRQGFMPISNLDGSRFLIKLLYKYSYRLIAQTNDMKNSMIEEYGLNPLKIIVISNLLDTYSISKINPKCFPFINQNANNYLAIGRIGKFKDYETLIKAFDIVQKKTFNSHLYILGSVYDSSYFSFLNDLVVSKGLVNNVHFEGFSNSPYEYLYHCNCFILSSETEGLPNVLLEALYMGKPVVATKCIPIISELIIDGKNGYSVDVKDYQSMAVAMQKAISMNVIQNPLIYKTTNEDIDLIFN